MSYGVAVVAARAEEDVVVVVVVEVEGAAVVDGVGADMSDMKCGGGGVSSPVW